LWERDEDEARRGSPSKTAAERVGTERVALVSAAVDRPGATDGKPASPVPVVGSNATASNLFRPSAWIVVRFPDLSVDFCTTSYMFFG
jgi:hypothetical protein